MLVITTPNTWHMAARLKYLARGFFPGFPSLAGIIDRLFASILRSNPKRKARKAANEEERRYRETAASDASMLSRRLVVSARKPA